MNVCGAYCFRSDYSLYIFLSFFSFGILPCIRSSSYTSRLGYPAASIIVSGLEASRAPYSKSHARRLKRKEREGLAGGGMESLKSALPSITTMITSGGGVSSSKSAGEDRPNDMPATSSNTTTAAAASAGELDPKSESVAALEATTSSPPTRLGQIGEGKGTPLTRSQRRRALWVIFSLPPPSSLKTRRSVFLYFYFGYCLNLGCTGKPSDFVNR